jgi:hypothetical protein
MKTLWNPGFIISGLGGDDLYATPIITPPIPLRANRCMLEGLVLASHAASFVWQFLWVRLECAKPHQRFRLDVFRSEGTCFQIHHSLPPHAPHRFAR